MVTMNEQPKCPKCDHPMYRNGIKKGKQRYKCSECGHETINPSFNSNPSSSTHTPGISVQDLLKTHDVEELVKTGLKKLTKGRLFTEAEFIDISGIRGKNYRSVLNKPEIKQYTGKVDGITYYGVPEDITELKTRFVLR